MDFDFTLEQKILRQSAADFLSGECPFDKVKELEDSAAGYSPAIWKKIADLGWMEVCLPEEYGGCESSFFDIIILMEEMGKKVFPGPFFSTVIHCGQIILAGASEKLKKDLLPRIASGKLIMSLAQLEEDAGYWPESLQMTAERRGDHYILDGVKMFVPDANIADKLIVAARVPEVGVTLFLADAAAAGINVSKLPTIGKDNTCRAVFDKVKVPSENVVGQPGRGWEVLEKASGKAVAAKCAEMLGGCSEVISMTVAYAKRRVQYGVPIAAFQAIQHYLANMKLAYDTTLGHLYKTAWSLDQGLDAELETSILKARTNEQYKFISERGVHIHGGAGTTREFDVAMFYRNAKASEYILGDSDFHYEKVALGVGL